MKIFIEKHKEKISFLLAGAWNTLFGYFTFFILYSLFEKQLHYFNVLIISTFINITQNFISYKLLVFKTKGNLLKEYIRFYAVYTLSIGLNIILLPLFVEIFKLHPLVAQAILTVMIVIISYFGHKHFSFKEK
jgi:putative flippase GtrA